MPLGTGTTEGNELVWRIVDEDGNVIAGLDFTATSFILHLLQGGLINLHNYDADDPTQQTFTAISSNIAEILFQITRPPPYPEAQVWIDAFGLHPMGLDGALNGATAPSILGGTGDPTTRAAVNAVQEVFLNADPGPVTAGTITLDFDGDSIGPINWDDDNAAIQAAFDAALGGGNTAITGDGLATDGYFDVEFMGTLADSAQPLMTITDDSLVGDTAGVGHQVLGKAIGTEAALSTTYQRDDAGELWVKTGAGDTDWTNLTP